MQKRFSVLFRCAGAGLIYAHFSLREISKTADRGGAGHPWARFPCCALTPLLWAINGKEVQKLPTTAVLCPPACGFRARGPDGSRAGCWCLSCGAGAGAVVLVLWCWCCGAGAGAGAVVLSAGCIPHPAQGHRRTRAGHAAYVPCAGSQTTGCRFTHPPLRLF